MKTARMTGLRQISVERTALPELVRAQDVRLRIRAVGICGSDKHYYLNGRIGNQTVTFPFTPGHECTAEVESVGPGVSRLKPGDRVFIDPAIACGVCDQCRSDRRHTCRMLKFVGCPGQMEGCLSEVLVMPQENCYPLPDGISFSMGVLIEPVSIALYGLRLLGQTDMDAVGILGSGPIGLSMAVALRASRETCRLYMSDVIDARLTAAGKAGADWSGNPLAADIVPPILEQEPLGLDMVCDCCGDQDAYDQAVALLKPGGTLLIVGIPENERISFNPHALRRKEIVMKNVRRQNAAIPAAIELVSRRRKELAFMLTHEFPLERSAEAFALAAGFKDGVIKAVIRI